MGESCIYQWWNFEMVKGQGHTVHSCNILIYCSKFRKTIIIFGQNNYNLESDLEAQHVKCLAGLDLGKVFPNRPYYYFFLNGCQRLPIANK
jgi:hypothetical protein